MARGSNAAWPEPNRPIATALCPPRAASEGGAGATFRVARRCQKGPGRIPRAAWPAGSSNPAAMKQPQRNSHTNRHAGPFPARTRRPIMLSKLSLSLTAALALSAARVGVARADPMPTSTDEAREMAHPSTNAELDAAEAGNPRSTDYSDRTIPSRSSTDDDINAVESGSPDSGDNKDQQRLPSGENWRSEEHTSELQSQSN